MSEILWKNMVNNNNITNTENGDKAYKSSLNGLSDLLFKAGVMRSSSYDEVIKIFIPALSENPLYAIRLLFYIRDIRGGQGCKNFFYKSMNYLMLFYPDIFNSCIQYIPEYGSWKDIFVLLSYAKTNKDDNAYKFLMEYIKNQFIKDLSDMKENKSVSLLIKWLPSENTSSKETCMLAKDIRKYLNLNSKEYRKALSIGRKYIDVVERKIASKDYLNINYNIVPSCAMQKYRNAFIKNDNEHFTNYLNNIIKGTGKVNARTLYPYDIVSKLTNHTGIFNSNSINKNELTLLIEQWKALPDFFNGKKDNSIVIADVSGSMYGIPMCVCVSLAIYIAQRNTGLYHNKFITFSDQPTLVELSDNLIENLIKLKDANWNMSTNIDNVFKLLYTSITPTNKHEIPSTIYIISDMQFNQCITGNNKTVFERWKEKFNNIGLELPTIVFWNVASNDYNNVPITINDNGAIIISGFSPSILSYIMGNSFNNTLELIENIVLSNRYKNILSNFFKN